VKGRGDRPARVAERIREEVSLILQRKVRDPGLESVTVTEVTVTPDLRNACVRYSVLGGEEERRIAASALRRSRSFIRRELGKVLGLRFLPEMAFQYDDSYERNARIGTLLREFGEHETGDE
jgi:ribosome-binding factor A